MGNSWPEPIDGSNIGTYTNGYDHTGYWQVLPAFIKAYKAGNTDTNTMYPTNGKVAQGVFWHHTLLANGDCGADPMGKPQGANTVEDKVTVSSSSYVHAYAPCLNMILGHSPSRSRDYESPSRYLEREE